MLRVASWTVRFASRSNPSVAILPREELRFGSAMHSDTQDSEHHAADLADRTTLPILLLGAAALVQGGLSMAKTTIRPDYLTGPAISEKMSGLATVIRAANDGIVIAGNSYLEKLLKCDSIVFDDSVAWQSPRPVKRPLPGWL